MSRVIEFRFGSYVLGKFVVPDDAIFVGALKDPKMGVMQYTCRGDIDGKKVFEGDLLRFPGNDHTYLVKWLNDEGCWGVMYNDSLQMGKVGVCQFMQVVGNVYENPGEFHA